jgi:tripartite-type tricarboxylate transporter receptor subunit TctC
MNRTKKSWVLWLGGIILSACLAGGSGPAAAKEKTYPAREINICIGSPPGGSLDISGRIIAKVLTKLMDQPMVIVNKPGGNQALSFAFVANARPDGYTLAYILNPYLTMKKLEEPDLPYDAEKMTWLGSMYHFNFMLTVKADSPWKTYEEFVDFGRKNPDKIIFGSDGAGGPQHINQLQFAEMVGIKSFIHVPFSGGGPAIQALLGGHVNAVTTSPGPTAAYVRSKDLRYLVNFAPIRNPEYPDVPSIKEKGVNLFTGGWMAFAGPKGLPAPIVERLVKDLKEAAMADEVKPTFKNMGWEPEYHPPQDCVKMWKEEEVIFAKQMKKLGMIK